jgi:hypothetical protein
MADRLKAALAAGNQDEAVAARNAMWDAVYQLHKALYAADQVWNEFSPRATESVS